MCFEYMIFLRVKLERVTSGRRQGAGSVLAVHSIVTFQRNNNQQPLMGGEMADPAEQKAQLNDQLKEYISEWKMQRQKEE